MSGKAATGSKAYWSEPELSSAPAALDVPVDRVRPVERLHAHGHPDVGMRNPRDRVTREPHETDWPAILAVANESVATSLAPAPKTSGSAIAEASTSPEGFNTNSSPKRRVPP